MFIIICDITFCWFLSGVVPRGTMKRHTLPASLKLCARYLYRAADGNSGLLGIKMLSEWGMRKQAAAISPLCERHRGAEQARIPITGTEEVEEVGTWYDCIGSVNQFR